MIILALGCRLGGSPSGGIGDKIKNLTIPTIDPKEPFPALSTDAFDALSAEVPELAKHRDAVLAAERDAIKGALDDIRAKSKAANKKAGDAIPEPALLTLVPWPRTDVWDAPIMGAGNDDRPSVLIGGLFDLMPVAMAAEPDLSSLGSTQQFLIGHQIAFMQVDAGKADRSFGTGSKTIAMTDEKTGEVQATATVSVDTAGGSFTMEITTKLSMPVFGLDAGSKVSITGNACPNSDGKVDLTVKLGSNGRAGRAGSLFYDKNIEARIMATVGDDANLVSTDIDIKQATHSSAGGQQVDLITSQSVQVTGDEYPNGKFGEAKLIRGSKSGTLADQQSSEDGLTRAYYLAIGALESARERWQGGACIKIEATSPGTVAPSSTTAIPVTVRHLFDGSEVPSKLDAKLSGGKSVDPTTLAKTRGTLTYTAPGETGKSATIGLTATSRRGRATLDLDANTGGKSYRVAGTSNGVSFTGEICSLDKPFVIDATYPGGTAKTTFAPGGATKVSGGGGGCDHSGGGNYTVTLNEDGSGTLTWTTSDKITCPYFGNSKTSTFTLPLQPAPEISCP